jgi:hypothetical protein
MCVFICKLSSLEIGDNKDLRNMQVLNCSNAYNSKEALTQELMCILQTHKMPSKYICEKECKEIEKDFKEKRNQIKNNEMDDIVKTLLITYVKKSGNI